MLNNFAIVFSYENKTVLETIVNTDHEKMAMALAFSIRQHMPAVPVFCGSFTNNTPSDVGRRWFTKYNVNLLEELIFDDIGKSDGYMFLRTFTKDYFAKKLLSNYDFLLYLDIDVLALRPFEFPFDPSGPMVLTEKMPNWIKKWHLHHLDDFEGNLYYNWIEIINTHNSYLFDLDFTDPYVTKNHNADKIVSTNIDNSDLEIIDQNIGGYHPCLKPPAQSQICYHYDSLGQEGSLHAIKDTHPAEYQKYMMLFKDILNTKISNQPGYWENIKNSGANEISYKPTAG